MGFPRLAIIYKSLRNRKKYAYYMKKARLAMNGSGHLPVLYYAGSKEHNKNTPPWGGRRRFTWWLRLTAQLLRIVS